MLRVRLTASVKHDAQERLRSLIARKIGGDDGVAAAQILLASLPGGIGFWNVPKDAEFMLRRHLGDLPEVAAALRLDKIAQRRDSAEYLKRLNLGRKLFDQYVGATNPEILASVWHNLSQEDRHYWVMLADKQLAGE